MMLMIDHADFEELDLRVGTVLTVNDFPQALKPAYKLQIDFGPLGKFDTSAQLTQTYTKEELEGRQVIAVLNLGSKKIANFESQCLVLGAEANNEIILLAPESKLPNGQQIL